MSRRTMYFVSLAVAALLTVCGLYCVLWIFSSADMPFVACDNTFSLFSPSPRLPATLCRDDFSHGVSGVGAHRRTSSAAVPQTNRLSPPSSRIDPFLTATNGSYEGLEILGL
jgi:hypothetical protein